MNKKKIVLPIILSALLLNSCTSYKNVPYLQNSDEVNVSTANLFDAKIMPKDILSITVNCPEEPKAVAMFNMTMQSNYTTNSTSANFSSQIALQSYLVENDGTINFPILGKLNVMGLTKSQLEDKIAGMIFPEHLNKKPIVVVSMANYKVAVLGEVASPGVYTVQNGKINILEALAMAKDMTIYGRRDSVKVIREDVTGRKTVAVLCLNDANIINSPYYQLQQNDVVYVVPNKAKAKNSGIGSETTLWFSSVSILISLASLLYNILK